MNRWKNKSFVLILAIVGLPVLAASTQLPSQQYRLKPVATGLSVAAQDHAKLLEQDASIARKGLPLRYAIANAVNADAKALGKKRVGSWENLPNGMAIWRLNIAAPGAVSIDLGFSQMQLPDGAQLFIASVDGKQILGPYTANDNTKSGQFWTPIIQGENAQIELLLPQKAQKHLKLVLGTVHYGYRDIWSGQSSLQKSGSCNIDTICPQGNNHRDQIRAVARYTVSGSACTGQLINNVAGDRRPLLITASHCLSTQSAADTVVTYWKYENAVCRAPGSSQSGISIPLAGNSITQTGGTTLRMSHANSDTTLLELNTAIPSAADPYWYGWDRTENIPTSSSVVHHPQGHEKRISHDFNSAQLQNGAVSGLSAGNSFWRVVEWDEGTTEQGSSGSGLMNQQKRLIGVLSGGGAACGNQLDDFFGRLSTAWEGGGAANSRLRDWLDPSSSGANTLDGRSSCNAPSVNLSISTSAIVTGQEVSLNVSANGGTGSFSKYAFDVDGDGVIDREGTQTSLPIKFPLAYNGPITAHVTDSSGCTGSASVNINVAAPDIVASAGTPSQMCGDGDNVIEPGEQWQLPVSLRNQGGHSINNGYAIFTDLGASSASLSQTSDTFGYRYADDSTGCGYNFVDINSTASPLALTASSSFAANDDGRSPVISVNPFNMYGQSVNQVVMSTNGYISTSAQANGGDFDNDCGLVAPDSDNVGSRLNSLHDDLVISTAGLGGLRHQFFSACPRASESANNASCHVFQWSRAGIYVSATQVSGDFDFQTILYPASGQIVYQYRGTVPNTGATATIGTLRQGGVDGLEYACNRANAAQNGRAVCIFHPQSPPLAGSKKLALQSYSSAVAQIASFNGLANTQVVFQVDPTAACGSSARIGFDGVVDANSVSRRTAILLEAPIGQGGNCQVRTGCSQSSASPVSDGLYANSNRFGNGIGAFYIPASPAPVFFGAWFTGEANRSPSWRVVQGPSYGNQVDAKIYSFVRNVNAPTFSVTSSIVGSARVTTVAPNVFALTWDMAGKSGGELMSDLYPLESPTLNRTAAWYNANESGWGQVIDTHLMANSQTENVTISYLYDGLGFPRWTLGGSANTNNGTVAHSTFRVHCPSCPSFPDFGNLPISVGSNTHSFGACSANTLQQTNSLTTAFSFPAPFSGTWNRSAQPQIPLTAVSGTCAN